MHENEKIDIVYTWVDDSDSNWREEREKALVTENHLISKDANAKNRFRNRDELKYSLRSIDKFAKFINHIYIVTANQRPQWLKDHPKITVVSHEDIFPNKNHLPTFNSQAIEAHLHRIPNLSEKFLYFNDDCLLGSLAQPSDFFTADGKICIYLSENQISSDLQVSNPTLYHSACKNTDELLSKTYKKETRYEVAHTPYALTKSLVQETSDLFPEIFDLVSSHKFRMPSDFTLTNGLVQYHALYTQKGIIAKNVLFYIPIASDIELLSKRLAIARSIPCKFLCLHDIANEDTEMVIDFMIERFLETFLPEPAPWEH